MLDTVTDLYKAFLVGIKKESTSVVTPTKFNSIINTAQMIWVKNNIKYADVNQNLVDDLRVLHKGPEVIDPTSGYSNTFTLPTDYMRSLSILIALTTVPVSDESIDKDDETITAGAAGASDATDIIYDYKKVHYMRSDQRSANYDSYYRKPGNDRIYYYFDGNTIKVESNSYAQKMKLEYLRKPNDIEYIKGEVGTNCELPELQRQEIVDIAINYHLRVNVSHTLKSGND